MPSSVVIDITGAVELAERIERPEVIREPLETLVRDVALVVERAAREGMPRDTAEGARSIAATVNGLEAKVTSPLAHVTVMDQGRRAGAAMPPQGALLGWMRRHGIPPEAEYVVRRGIARRGIKGRFFYQKAEAKGREAIPGAVRKFMAEVQRRASGG